VPRQRSFGFRVKKQVNDLLRRLTGYQFVKVNHLEALEAAAKPAESPQHKGGRRTTP
jgi:hypothetical protein